MNTGRCIYITCDRDHDYKSAIVSLYTFIKYKQHSDDNFYIIYNDDIPQNTRDIMVTLTSGNVKFLPSGPEVKRLLTSYMQCIDITDKIFDISTGEKTAVVAYVYYYEHWMEIYNHVKKLSEHTPIDLHVYMCTACNSTQSKHIMNCHQTEDLKIYFNWTKNNGRDVRSFLSFIKNKQYIKYDKICKIHTKKTTYLDDNWRSIYLQRLLSPDYVEDHWYKLKHGHNITSVDKYIIHEKHMSSAINYHNMCKLISLLDLKLPNMGRYSFYAGTMFWCSNRLCKFIDKQIDESHLAQFEEEPIKNDGSLAHAWERVFSLL